MKRLSPAQTVLQLATQRPLVRAADVVDLGVSTVVLTRLVAANKLERVARGLYSLPGRSVSEHRTLAEASLMVPRGIVCLLSALRVHEIGTQASSEVWLALPQHTKAPRSERLRLSLRIVHMSGHSLTAGIDHQSIDGVEVPVFDAEKTVVDCFKFRNKIGLDVALEALKDGWRRGKLSMDKLWHYATIDRVTNVMRPYLESLEG
jgi:predicted transcriptional regulator of viral defense system